MVSMHEKILHKAASLHGMGKVQPLETSGEQVTQSFLGHIQTLVFTLCEAFWEIFGQT